MAIPDLDDDGTPYTRTITPADPRIATLTMTSPACPEQYEGTLTDGRHLYFKYRHGIAQLGIGDTEEQAGTNARDVLAYGHPLDGLFATTGERDRILTHLLDQAHA